MGPLRSVAIVGVGLIGGSIGLALRRRGIASEVVGIGRNPGSLAEAVRVGAVGRATTDFREGAASADVVVVCTPVDRIAEDVRRVAEVAESDVLITDAGSSKRQIVEAVERQAGCASVFVGAHPIAGSERRGVAHARADLFEGRPCVLTPTAMTPSDRIRRAGRFWEAIGCRVLRMGPAEHDEVLAYTSHLPHALAAALAGSVPADWLPLGRRRVPRLYPRRGRRHRALDGHLPRESRAVAQGASTPCATASASFQYALMTDDEDAIRRWWDEARRRRLHFEELAAGTRTPPPSD